MDQAEGGDYNRLNFVCQEQMKRANDFNISRESCPMTAVAEIFLRWEMAEGLLKDVN